MLRDTVDSGLNVNFRQDPTTGILTFWDTSRSMYIGVDRQKFTYGIDHANVRRDMWMRMVSRINTMANGSLISRDALITCISVVSANKTDAEIEVYTNDILKTSIILTDEDKKVDDSLSISLDSNDVISVLCKPLNNKVLNYPSLTIEVAWR